MDTPFAGCYVIPLGLGGRGWRVWTRSRVNLAIEKSRLLNGLSLGKGCHLLTDYVIPTRDLEGSLFPNLNLQQNRQIQKERQHVQISKWYIKKRVKNHQIHLQSTNQIQSEVIIFVAN